MFRPRKNRRKPQYGGKASRPKPRGRRRPPAQDGPVRLQKALADAGIGSRRQCEEMILEGRVEVDGQVVAELGTRVDPANQEIRVDGEVLKRPKRVYYLVNKPLGVISSSRDPAGRMRVIDLAPGNHRLFTVGRLDQSSEGLILVTNDGPLCDLLTHPRYGVEKTYLAEVAGSPTPEALEKLRRGVHLAEGYAHAKKVFVRRSHKQSSLLEIVLDEGRNREVRRLLARIGHKVMKLKRIAIGPIRLGNLKPGEHRPLKAEEVEELYRIAREGRREQKKAERRKPAAAAPPAHADQEEPFAEESVPLVRPLIDHSIPDDDELEGELIGLDETGDEDFDEEEERAAVDLSPIRPRKSDAPVTGTVIGGHAKKSEKRPRKPRRGKGFRDKKAHGKKRSPSKQRGNQSRGR